MAKKCKYDVAIITDGNPSIGLAHIRRCSAIASALQEIGLRCCFIASDSVSAAKIKSVGYKVYTLNEEYQNLSNQAIAITHILKEHQIKFAFFDSYFASNELFQKVGKQFKVGCFGYKKKYKQCMAMCIISLHCKFIIRNLPA